MESEDIKERSTSIPQTSAGPESTDIDATITTWYYTGRASLGEVSVDISQIDHDYSQSDLRMLYSLLQRCQPSDSSRFVIRTYIDAR